MRINCGKSWRQRRYDRWAEWDKAKALWHKRFVFKVRIDNTCYILQIMERRWISKFFLDTPPTPYWEYREPQFYGNDRDYPIS